MSVFSGRLAAECGLAQERANGLKGSRYANVVTFLSRYTLHTETNQKLQTAEERAPDIFLDFAGVLQAATFHVIN